MMPRMLLRVVIGCAVFLCALLVLMPGCKKEPPTAVYVPGSASGAQPVISSISPAAGALAGYSQLQLNGANFSTNPAEDFVYFDTARAIIQTATATSLTFLAPVVAKDSIQVRVGVAGSEQFSAPFIYSLQSVAPVLDLLDPRNNPKVPNDPKCLTHDALGNLYASIEPSKGVGASVDIYPPSGGTRASYAPADGGTATSYSGMKMGPGGILYVVSKQNRILTIASQGTIAKQWAIVGPRSTKLADLDFDASKNIWTAGTNGGTGDSIFSVTPAKVVRGFAFIGANVRSVRVFQGYLYAGGNLSGDEGVWRFQINSSDNLGPVEQYFDLSSAFPTAGKVNAIAFSADGDMYIGSDWVPMVVVHPGKSSEQVYPGLLQFQSISLSWGPGNQLFVARHDTSTAGNQNAIVRVNLQKPGAPYYGIQ